MLMYSLAVTNDPSAHLYILRPIRNHLDLFSPHVSTNEYITPLPPSLSLSLSFTPSLSRLYGS